MNRYLPLALCVMVILLMVIIALLMFFGMQHAPEPTDPYRQAESVLNSL